MPAGEAWTEQRHRNKRRDYARLYQGGHARVGKGGRPVIVPDDIEVRATDRPCFCCGASGACRHRLWLVQP